MRTEYTLLALTAFLCASTASTPAQARDRSQGELWIAASRTASSITGNILVSDSSLEMAGTVLPLRAAGTHPAWRTSDDKLVAARLFEVTRPAKLTLRNGNSFGCEEPVSWLVIWRSKDGRDLSMYTYTGGEKPRPERSPSPGADPVPSFRPDQAAKLCATYLYSRPARQQAARPRPITRR
jgi:hypothetical protein